MKFMIQTAFYQLLVLLFLVSPFSAYSVNASDSSGNEIPIDTSLVSFATKEDIYVVGDIHGAYEEFLKSLQTVQLIDDKKNWVGGKAHLVSLGDLMDRGPASRKVMDLFIALQQQAYQAGGRVHIILGNHEVMNLIGDLRYLSQSEVNEFAADESVEMRGNKYSNYLKSNQLEHSPELKSKFDKDFPQGYFARQAAFSPEGYYGSWLLKLPFVIQINQSLFAHGGLSKITQDYSLQQFNQEAKNGLTKYLTEWQEIVNKEGLSALVPYKQRGELIDSLNNDKLRKEYSQVKSHFILNSHGPTWYRGNAVCHPYFEQEQLATNLANWNANELWVGHTTSQIRKPLVRFGGALKIMDTGMLASHYNGVPWISKIPYSQDSVFIQGLTGVQEPPGSSPAREWNNPYNMSDGQVEEFLKTAEIKRTGSTKEGKTRPYKVRLTLGERSIKGIFKYYDSVKDGKGRSSKKGRYLTDRYQHEIAAYKLDRLLGIGLVPVTVSRKLNGKEGIIQVWVDDLISELTMVDNNIPYDGYCNQTAQDNFLIAFDYLIANRDRNQSNVLFSKSDFQVWFIDHSRSFGIKTNKPPGMKNADIYVSPQFKTALKKLNIDNLQSLKPWLKGRQLNAILKRRDKMINGEI